MANKDHLKLLKVAIENRNIAIWNRWRHENPDIRLDLSGEDLSGADLRMATLSRVNLSGACLLFSNLSGARLWYASLGKANLIGADLLDADLLGADLLGADFLGADLLGAILREARGLMPSQIRAARNWDSAFYNQGFLKSLGLSPDHNERMQQRISKTLHLNKGNHRNNHDYRGK